MRIIYDYYIFISYTIIKTNVVLRIQNGSKPVVFARSEEIEEFLRNAETPEFQARLLVEAVSWPILSLHFVIVN